MCRLLYLGFRGVWIRFDSPNTFTTEELAPLSVRAAEETFMCTRYWLNAALALALASSACTLSAHPIFVNTSDSVVADVYQPCFSPDDMLFAIPDSQEHPRLWRDMNAKERAEIWPFLPRGMKKRYWRSMTSYDRKAMREELAPRYNDELRSRFVSPNDDMPGHMRRHAMSDEERDRMREQIREMHVQIYRYHHGAPAGAVATPIPPQSANKPEIAPSGTEPAAAP